MAILLILFVILNLGMALIAIPLIRQRIPPNPLYGFRIRATLENPDIWYAVNAYFGKRLFVVGLISALSALVIYFLPGLSLDLYAYLCLILFALFFTVIMIDSFHYLRSIKP